jgi:hypothetical protein
MPGHPQCSLYRNRLTRLASAWLYTIGGHWQRSTVGCVPLWVPRISPTIHTIQSRFEVQVVLADSHMCPAVTESINVMTNEQHMLRSAFVRRSIKYAWLYRCDGYLKIMSKIARFGGDHGRRSRRRSRKGSGSPPTLLLPLDAERPTFCIFASLENVRIRRL